MDSLSVPVTTLGAQELERSGGKTNLLDALRKLAPQFTGDRNLGSESSNAGAVTTSGGSQIALRNLPTLVLVNGRRLASSPAAAAGGHSFVDLNGIPMSAIERVEVLDDGASAIYGSDAIGGVVNIVLKSDFQGFELGAHYGFSDNPGHWTERSVYVTGGASNGTTSLMLSAEWAKSDPLFQSERAFSSQLHDSADFAGVISVDAASKYFRADGRNYYLLNSALAQPPSGHQDLNRLVSLGVYSGPFSSTEIAQSFNRADYATLLQGNERKTLTASLNHKLAPDLSIFGELLYARTQTFAQSEAQPFTLALAGTAVANPTDSRITAHNRLVEYPKRYFSDTESIRGVAGVREKVNEFLSWEVSVQQHEVQQDYRNSNLIDIAARDAAISNGTLVITGQEQLADLDGIFGTAYYAATSKLTSFDGVIRAKAFDLPGGPFQVALAGQIQRESLVLTADRNSNSDTFGWEGGARLDPFDQRRSLKSLALEISLPIFGGGANIPYARALAFDFALRRDSYNDVNVPTVPKYVVRWQPFDRQFAVRGSFSRSYAVPTLYQLYGPTEIGRTNNLAIAVHDAFGTATGQTVGGQAWVRTGANASLAATRAENFTAGLAYTPKGVSGLSLSADYFHVNQYNVVGTLGAATILASVEKLGTESPYASLVRLGKGGYAESYFDGGTAISDEGKISNAGLSNVFVTDRNINLGTVKLDGVDLAARYSRSFQGVGRFDLSTTATVYNHYRVRSRNDVDYQEISNRITSSFGSRPDWRSYSTLAYLAGGFDLSVAHTFIPSMEDMSGLTTEERRVGSYTQFDVQASYAFGREIFWLRGTRVTLGVENVLNAFGPRSPTYTQSNIDLSTYGAVGRKFHVGLQHKF